MSFGKFFPITVIISALAVTMMALDIAFQKMLFFGEAGGGVLMMQTFIAFQAWAMYFMAGCTIKDGVRVFLGYVGGAVASIAIIALALGPFAGMGDYKFLIPVFLVVIPVICAERVKWLDFVPAWFVGAGIYFGTFTLYAKISPEGTPLTSLYLHTAVAVLLSCLWGLIYGWVTVYLRVKYTNAVTTEEAPAEPEPEAADA